ncbi:hypothetical protein TREES_T100004652 [Tupaia chinensis]|uniref:Protein FAM219B n=1 Tax=Tupaia chinensis TaxID=246437 RepID=L8YEB3_TUPCH|nr:hypothetical protein TREES_T100004652 [Tupaia chinensis]
MVTRAPSIQAKLRECGPTGVVAARDLLGDPPGLVPGGQSSGAPHPHPPLRKICPETAVSPRAGDASAPGRPADPHLSLPEKHRDLAKAVLRRKGMLGASPRPDSAGKRSVKFNKGYTALSQSPDENLVSLDSDSPPCPLQQVNQDVSRQLLQDGYHLDEIPDDEDLDLIPPKPMASSACSCCWCCPGDSSCTLQ